MQIHCRQREAGALREARKVLDRGKWEPWKQAVLSARGSLRSSRCLSPPVCQFPGSRDWEASNKRTLPALAGSLPASCSFWLLAVLVHTHGPHLSLHPHGLPAACVSGPLPTWTPDLTLL